MSEPRVLYSVHSAHPTLQTSISKVLSGSGKLEAAEDIIFVPEVRHHKRDRRKKKKNSN